MLSQLISTPSNSGGARVHDVDLSAAERKPQSPASRTGNPVAYANHEDNAPARSGGANHPAKLFEGPKRFQQQTRTESPKYQLEHDTYLAEQRHGFILLAALLQIGRTRDRKKQGRLAAPPPGCGVAAPPSSPGHRRRKSAGARDDGPATPGAPGAGLHRRHRRGVRSGFAPPSTVRFATAVA